MKCASGCHNVQDFILSRRQLCVESRKILLKREQASCCLLSEGAGVGLEEVEKKGDAGPAHRE